MVTKEEEGQTEVGEGRRVGDIAPSVCKSQRSRGETCSLFLLNSRRLSANNNDNTTTTTRNFQDESWLNLPTVL